LSRHRSAQHAGRWEVPFVAPSLPLTNATGSPINPLAILWSAMIVPIAHVAGLPLEETVAALAPMLGVGVGALVLAARSKAHAAAHRLRRLRRAHRPRWGIIGGEMTRKSGDRQSRAEEERPVRRGGGREALCAAVLRVVARSGLDGVTYRSVAAEAGVTHGSASYHFATRDEMIQEALRWASRHSIQVSRIATDGSLDDFAANLPELMTRYPEESMFSFEMILESVRRPALASDVRASYYEFIDAVRESLGRMGLGDNLPLARVVFAAIDGLSLQHLIYRDPGATEEGIRTLQHLLRLALAAIKAGEPA
jgi:AcrR family transcriptional regulator